MATAEEATIELEVAIAVFNIAVQNNYVLVIDHLRDNVNKARKALDKVTSRSPIEGLRDAFFDIVAPRQKKGLPITNNDVWLPRKLQSVSIHTPQIV